MKSLRDGSSIPRRSHRAGIDRTRKKRRQHLRRAAGLKHGIVSSRLHVAPFKSLQSEIMSRAANPCHADFLAAQILQSFDFRFREDALRQKVLNARDENEICISLYGGPHDA